MLTGWSSFHYEVLMSPKLLIKVKSDAQKVTNFTDTTCAFRFLGSRIDAASRVRSDHPIVRRGTLTSFT